MSDQNWLQIRILHQKIHRIKENNILFLYDLKTQKFQFVYKYDNISHE